MSKKNISKIDFLKIDTEGYEFEVLSGAKNNIKNVNLVLFEHHYHDMIKKNYKFGDVHKLLNKNNFEQIYKAKMPFRKTFEYIYRNRTYATDKYDYDCSRGSGVVTKFTKDEKMDGFRSSPCASECDSGRCLLTGKKIGSTNEICCAWDTYTTMSGDPTLNVDAVFISMRDADVLRASPLLATPAPNALWATLATRPRQGGLVFF